MATSSSSTSQRRGKRGDHSEVLSRTEMARACAQVGAVVKKDETMGAVESVKAASDVYAPVSGEVTDVNGALNDEPALINSSAESDGWMCKVKLSKPDELDGLMDADAYKKFCDE